VLAGPVGARDDNSNKAFAAVWIHVADNVDITMGRHVVRPWKRAAFQE